jgi:arsenate reductase-like glutaredoxin family protein
VDLDALAEAVIGPTGGLRAPTLMVGDAVLVGFGPEEWAEFFDAV